MSQPPSRRKPWLGLDGARARRSGLIVAVVASALVAAFAVLAFGAILYAQSRLQREHVDLPEKLPNEPFNVLVLGSDSRAGLSPEEQATKGTTEQVQGQRADTIILLHIDPRTKKTVVVHFPRDLRVRIPGKGAARINTAFEGGAPLMIRTVQRFTGLPIHHYVRVDFSGFQRLVDAMGGVPICVDRPMRDRLAELNLPEAGCYNLSGRVALAFVRARNVEGDLIPDLARISRQQQFIRALLNKLLSPSSGLRLPSLARAAAENVTVDERLSLIDVNDIVRRLRGLGTADVDFRVVPSTPVTIEGASYLEPVHELANEMFDRLRRGARLGNLGKEVYSTDNRANIAVALLDAGGDVALVRDRLEKGGFDVQTIFAAPDGQRETRILYRAGHEPGAATVARFLGGVFELGPVSVTSAPKGLLGHADVGVVVGDGFVPRARRTAS